jgi:hypothetical protein
LKESEKLMSDDPTGATLIGQLLLIVILTFLMPFLLLAKWPLFL